MDQFRPLTTVRTYHVRPLQFFLYSLENLMLDPCVFVHIFGYLKHNVFEMYFVCVILLLSSLAAKVMRNQEMLREWPAKNLWKKTGIFLKVYIQTHERCVEWAAGKLVKISAIFGSKQDTAKNQVSMNPGEHPGSPPDCTKCGAEGSNVRWDSELQLWRGDCSKPFCAAMSGRVRKSPHQVFTFLDSRIFFAEHTDGTHGVCFFQFFSTRGPYGWLTYTFVLRFFFHQLCSEAISWSWMDVGSCATLDEGLYVSGIEWC